MEKISIIILNYKLPEMTCACINSIIEHTQNVDYEIVLVDNGSQDNSKNIFDSNLSKISNINIIYSDINLGFGMGNNLGVNKATGDYIFILNNDTLFYENSLKILLEEFKSLSARDDIGFIQPRLYLNKEKDKVQQTNAEIPTLFELLQENIGVLQKINKERFKKFRYLDWDRNSSRFVDVVCGAAMFCKKDFFTGIGQFDKRFFLYFEEYDICQRAREKNLKNYYTTKTSIIHLHNMSPNSTWKKKRIYLESFIKYCNKKFLCL